MAHEQRMNPPREALSRSVALDKPMGESNFLADITFLTHDGTNAEAYWSFDGNMLSFQAIRGALGAKHNCDQIYIMKKDGNGITLLSNGEGRTTYALSSRNDKLGCLSERKLNREGEGVVEGGDALGWVRYCEFIEQKSGDG